MKGLPPIKTAYMSAHPHPELWPIFVHTAHRAGVSSARREAMRVSESWGAGHQDLKQQVINRNQGSRDIRVWSWLHL